MCFPRFGGGSVLFDIRLHEHVHLKASALWRAPVHAKVVFCERVVSGARDRSLDKIGSDSLRRRGRKI